MDEELKCEYCEQKDEQIDDFQSENDDLKSALEDIYGIIKNFI